MVEAQDLTFQASKFMALLLVLLFDDPVVLGEALVFQNLNANPVPRTGN